MPRNHSTESLRPKELDAVYAISQVIAETLDIDKALEKITTITRQIFIFDSAVIYFVDEENSLEPVFARSIGRGKSSPTDILWGDKAAAETIKTGLMVNFETPIEKETDRIDQPFFLSFPMLIAGKLTGALVYIRFGGPSYSEEQIHLAQFITNHISQLFERQRLAERIADLEAARRFHQFQDDFLALVSHELRTPLGFIKGYTTTLLRENAEWNPETRREFLTIIDEEADRLNELIENLLESSRLQSSGFTIQKKAISFAEFIEQHLESTLSRFDHILDIQINAAKPNEKMLADSKRLTQVIENLVNNAAKYTPNSKMRIDLESIGNLTTIRVQDDGPGIPEKHAEKIFERFYRVPERSGGVRGTGLGLYICKIIMDAHDGSIVLDTKRKAGTCFIIQLPSAKNGE